MVALPDMRVPKQELCQTQKSRVSGESLPSAEQDHAIRPARRRHLRNFEQRLSGDAASIDRFLRSLLIFQHNRLGPPARFRSLSAGKPRFPAR
jgi:hypothetical protein